MSELKKCDSCGSKIEKGYHQFCKKCYDNLGMTIKQYNIIRFIFENTLIEWDGEKDTPYEFIGKYWKKAKEEHEKEFLRSKKYVARGGCDPDTAIEYGELEYF